MKIRYLLMLVVTLMACNLAVAGGGSIDFRQSVECHAGQCTGVPEGWTVQPWGEQAPEGKFRFIEARIRANESLPQMGTARVRYGFSLDNPGMFELVSPDNAIAVEYTARANKHYRLMYKGNYQCDMFAGALSASQCWMYAW